MTSGYPIGLARLMLWEVGQSGAEIGRCLGQQTTLANGSASGAYVTSDVETANLSLPDPEVVEIKAGDKIVATHSFAGGKLSPFDVTGPAIDTALTDRITGSTRNTANPYAEAVAYNANKISARVMGAALQQQYKLNTGLTYFLTRMIPFASLTFSPGGATWRGLSTGKIHIDPIKATTSETGQSYGTAGLNLNQEDDLTDFYDWITPNPFHIMAFRQNTAVTTFNTFYKPISTVITLDASENRFYIDAVKTALASITTAGVATLSAAGTVGKLDTLMYATNFVPA